LRFGSPTNAPDGCSVLLLLTVGLLLIGLVTLVIGFLNSSLALDYISIAASALSFALVLLFTRLGRARSARSAAGRGAQAPPALAHSDTGLLELDSDSLGPETATIPRASRASRAAEQPPSQVFDEPSLEEADELDEEDEALWEPQAPPPPMSARSAGGASPYERPPVPAPDVRPSAAPAPGDRFEDSRFEDEGDDAGAGAHVPEYDDLEFPIADYDELRVGEILPLLEELEPDEIEVVRERELAGRNRGVVLRKLDELTGPVGAPPAGSAPSGRRPEVPVANGTRQRPAVPPPVDDAYDEGYEGVDEEYDDGGRDDGPVAFPIADYDDLRLTEVLPLLPQLEPVELELVRQRELQGERRATLLNRIDALIGTGTPRAPARQSR
jgi:hypothetical protein